MPITSYVEAAIGYDIYGNALTGEQRLEKLVEGIDKSTSAFVNGMMMAGTLQPVGLPGTTGFSLDQQALIDLAKEAMNKGVTN
jgi:hypothetical protein